MQCGAPFSFSFPWPSDDVIHEQLILRADGHFLNRNYAKSLMYASAPSALITRPDVLRHHPAHRQLDTGGAAAALSVPIRGYLQPFGGLPVVGLLYLSLPSAIRRRHRLHNSLEESLGMHSGVILGHRTGETQLRSYLTYLLRNHFDSGPARENV